MTVVADSKQPENPDTGFEPMNPWRMPDLRIWRRNLPHLECGGATYFITLTCARGKELSAEDRTIVLDALLHWNGVRVFIDAAVVMPDHAHAVLRLAAGHKLGNFLKSVKSFCSRVIEGNDGGVWLDETFDHIIRHEDEWREKIEYIRQNPVKRGLAVAPEEYRWIYIK